MVPQSGRKDFQSDNRFSMNPALPDSLYHSAAQPNSMRTFSGGATEKCCRISPKRHYTIAPPSRVLYVPFPAALLRNAVAFLLNDIIPDNLQAAQAAA